MKKKIIIDILIVILLGIFIFSTSKIGFFLVEKNNNENMNKELVKEVVKTEIITTDEEEKIEKFIIDYDTLLNINKDVKGWIRYNSDKVNYPLVQTTDNKYYLSYAYNKKKNSLGSIFIDYRNKSLNDKNVVIYGHNTTDNAMFGSLKEALKNNFFDKEENHTIEIIDTENNSRYYEIFSIYTTTKEEYYITTNFTSDEEYQNFLNTLKNRSIKNFNVDLSNTNNIITLSTCNGYGDTDKRLAIHAKLKNV